MWQKGKQSHANYAQHNTDQSSHDNHWLPTPYHWWHHTVLTSSAPIKNSSNKKRIPNVPPKQIPMDQLTSSRYDSIQWTAFQQAFQWLAINEQWFISKLTHEWLPLQASHIMASASNQQHCPSCQRSLETPEHFLQCPHPNRQGIWEEFQQGLQKIYLKHDLQQPLQDILSEGYWLSHDPMWPTPNHIICQASLQEAIQQQAQP